MIEDFLNLDLHDTPIKSIKFDFENEFIILKVTQYDEEIQDLFDISLKFTNASNIYLDKVPLMAILEISNVNITTKDGIIYFAIFSFAYDSPNAFIDFSFEFCNVELIYLSGRKLRLK